MLKALVVAIPALVGIVAEPVAVVMNGVGPAGLSVHEPPATASNSASDSSEVVAATCLVSSAPVTSKPFSLAMAETSLKVEQAATFVAMSGFELRNSDNASTDMPKKARCLNVSHTIKKIQRN